MNRKALVLQGFNEKAVKVLRDYGFEVIIRKSSINDEDELAKEVASIEGLELIVVGMENISEKMISASPTLKVIGRTGVGCDQIDQNVANKYGICICNSPATSTKPVAEHVIFLMLSLAHKSMNYFNAINTCTWEKVKPSVIELKGKILGIIGCGRIGKTLAEYAGKLGMIVIGYDPKLREGEKIGDMTIVSEEAIYRTSDFVSLHIPATEKTIGSIGKNKFNIMKSSAFLINCARGSIVVEEDLVDALQKKRIAGAGIDVYVKEPINSDNPLLKLDNVVLTPHCADFTERVIETHQLNASRIFVDLFESGDSPFIINHPDREKRAKRWSKDMPKEVTIDEENIDEAAEQGLFLTMSSGKHAHFLYDSMMTKKGFNRGLPSVETQERQVVFLEKDKLSVLLKEKYMAVGFKTSFIKNDNPAFNMTVKSADYVVITSIPDFGVVGMDIFKIMKKEAYLIDLTGGQAVDANELITALNEGFIAGAGLDWKEASYELLNRLNVIVIPAMYR